MQYFSIRNTNFKASFTVNMNISPLCLMLGARQLEKSISVDFILATPFEEFFSFIQKNTQDHAPVWRKVSLIEPCWRRRSPKLKCNLHCASLLVVDQRLDACVVDVAVGSLGKYSLCKKRMSRRVTIIV